MKHYEIVFLVHPDQSAQVADMVERYSSQITGGGGQVHRVEDWGRRQLAYPVEEIHKAHYVLMNIECDVPTLNELTTNFRYNDAILRNLVISKDKAVTEASTILEQVQREKSRESDDAKRTYHDDKPVVAASVAESEESRPQTEAVDVEEAVDASGSALTSGQFASQNNPKTPENES